MLLIGTPNPAVDRTMVIPGLRLGERHRARQVLVTAGGKGLNVARTARIIGQNCRVCAPLGGWAGQYLAHLASSEGIEGHWSWIDSGETRTCILVVDSQASDATPLDEQGPQLNRDDWECFAATMLASASESRMAILSGSLPPGIPSDSLASLIRDLSVANCPVVVDTSGEPLRAAIKASPYAIKVNKAELLQVMGPTDYQDPYQDVHQDPYQGGMVQDQHKHLVQIAELLQKVRQSGVELAIASLGADGAIAVCSEGIYHAYPPAIPVVSTVGSGDALSAGLIVGLLRGDSMADALRYGVACGTANALTIGGGRVLLADVKRILEQTTGVWL